MEAVHLFGAVLLYLLICSSQFSSAQQGYQRKSLDLHNRFRARHRSPPLQMDNNLNNIAVRCAQYYASRRKIDHSCPYKNGNGENLFAGGGRSWNGDSVADRSANLFYNEHVNYDYNTGSSRNGRVTGHFTAMVWRSSRRFGFGFAKVNDYAVGVALYSPHGNVGGRYKENVLRP